MKFVLGFEFKFRSFFVLNLLKKFQKSRRKFEACQKCKQKIQTMKNSSKFEKKIFFSVFSFIPMRVQVCL